jgi:hypothetical protein
MEHELQVRRLMMLIFAILSGASAISFAVLPAVF